MEGMRGSEIHPSDNVTPLRPSKHIWAYGRTSWTLAIPNIPNRGLTHLKLPTLPLHPPYPSCLPTPITCHQ